MTMLMLMPLLLTAASGATIAVRTVDKSWEALPGITVSVMEVDDCDRRQKIGDEVQGVTRADGAVAVQMNGGPGEYVVSAGGNGWDRRSQCLRIASAGPIYLEFQLRIDPVNMVTIEEPSTAKSTSESRSTFALTDFEGVYGDRAGQKYQVRIDPSGHGVEVEFPDVTTMTFPTRSDSKFTGPNGTIRFATQNRRVVSFELSVKPLEAAKAR